MSSRAVAPRARGSYMSQRFSPEPSPGSFSRPRTACFVPPVEPRRREPLATGPPERRRHPPASPGGPAEVVAPPAERPSSPRCAVVRPTSTTPTLRARASRVSLRAEAPRLPPFQSSSATPPLATAQAAVLPQLGDPRVPRGEPYETTVRRAPSRRCRTQRPVAASTAPTRLRRTPAVGVVIVERSPVSAARCGSTRRHPRRERAASVGCRLFDSRRSSRHPPARRPLPYPAAGPGDPPPAASTPAPSNQNYILAPPRKTAGAGAGNWDTPSRGS